MKKNNKLREALMQIYNRVNSLDENCGVDPVEIRDIARAALAESVKNSDVGTAEEQLKRKRAYCKAQDCRTCPLYGNDSLLCAFRWAQLPYNEGGAR